MFESVIHNCLKGTWLEMMKWGSQRDIFLNAKEKHARLYNTENRKIARELPIFCFDFCKETGRTDSILTPNAQSINESLELAAAPGRPQSQLT